MTEMEALSGNYFRLRLIEGDVCSAPKSGRQAVLPLGPISVVRPIYLPIARC